MKDDLTLNKLQEIVELIKDILPAYCEAGFYFHLLVPEGMVFYGDAIDIIAKGMDPEFDPETMKAFLLHPKWQNAIKEIDMRVFKFPKPVDNPSGACDLTMYGSDPEGGKFFPPEIAEEIGTKDRQLGGTFDCDRRTVDCDRLACNGSRRELSKESLSESEAVDSHNRAVETGEGELSSKRLTEGGAGGKDQLACGMPRGGLSSSRLIKG